MNWSDEHDYLDTIDAGYLTTTQFLNYNYCRDMFLNELKDDESHIDFNFFDWNEENWN